MTEPQWLTLTDAITHYGISRSSIDRWIRENPDNFVMKVENGVRYVDVANSKPPGNARLKGASMIPDGYITLGEAQEHYKVGRSTIHSWVREGHLVVKMFGSKKYIDTVNSKPPNTRNELVENWKEIPNFPDYEASTDGRIRNKKTCNVLTPNMIDNYHYVHLYVDKVPQILSVHRAIALTHIPNPDNKNTVNHKNMNKTDNKVENLEWATHSEQNYQKGYKQKRVVENHNNLEGEIWKVIDTQPNYMISNKGRVKNINTQKVLPCNLANYVEVKFSDGRAKVHRLVAKAFLSDYTDECVINHKDGNRHNNVVENLECTTQAQNVLHGYENGLNTNRVAVRMTRPDNTIVDFKSIKEASKITGLKAESIGYASKHGTNLDGCTWMRM
ncbi:endonuclease [Dishui Lake large algae virus 1]|nr:endonuclease [Dishui Lake large algae virus 1]